uniref:Glucosamine 6-phosphate N-acetyltransferase n=1 Tax=Equus asinus TaxID=9793 RepID=A0A9L0IYP8_EQUAS
SARRGVVGALAVPRLGGGDCGAGGGAGRQAGSGSGIVSRVLESPTDLERCAHRRASTGEGREPGRGGPECRRPPFRSSSSLLKEVDWSQNTATFSPAISPTHPGEGLVLRPLCTADLNRGFFKVLGQLTETGVVSPEQFMKSFEHMKKSGDYYVTVVEDVTLGQIVATATLIIEHKFIHSCAKRGRVEDVVVSDECRGKQLGKLLLSTLTLLSKKLNCYKITLECLPQNVGFYKKFGYTVSEENYMCRRFLK